MGPCWLSSLRRFLIFGGGRGGREREFLQLKVASKNTQNTFTQTKADRSLQSALCQDGQRQDFAQFMGRSQRHGTPQKSHGRVGRCPPSVSWRSNPPHHRQSIVGDGDREFQRPLVAAPASCGSPCRSGGDGSRDATVAIRQRERQCQGPDGLR